MYCFLFVRCSFLFIWENWRWIERVGKILNVPSRPQSTYLFPVFTFYAPLFLPSLYRTFPLVFLYSSISLAIYLTDLLPTDEVTASGIDFNIYSMHPVHWCFFCHTRSNKTDLTHLTLFYGFRLIQWKSENFKHNSFSVSGQITSENARKKRIRANITISSILARSIGLKTPCVDVIHFNLKLSQNHMHIAQIVILSWNCI